MIAWHATQMVAKLSDELSSDELVQVHAFQGTMPTTLAAEVIPAENVLSDGFPTSPTPFGIPESAISHSRA
jgi:hypothetical protein